MTFSTTCPDCGLDYRIGTGHLATECIIRLKADLSDMTDDRNQWVAHWNAAKTAYSVAVTERDQFEAEIERLRNTPCFECGHS